MNRLISPPFQRLLLVLGLLTSICTFATRSAAQTPPEKFLDADTIAIVRLRVSGLTTSEVKQTVAATQPELRQVLQLFLTRWSWLTDSLANAGAEDVYLVVSLANPTSEEVSVLVPGVKDWDASVLREWIAGPKLNSYQTQQIDETLVIAGRQAIKRFEQPSTELASTSKWLLEQLGGIDQNAAVAFACSLNNDQRRVVTAVMPERNPVVGDDGKHLLDVCRGITGSLTLGSRAEARLTVISGDDQSLPTSATKAIETMLLDMPGLTNWLPDLIARTADADANPATSSWYIRSDTLRRVLDSNQAAMANWMSQRLDAGDLYKLKRLGLAFHNHVSAWKVFPSVDLASDGSASGLSWRVRLLPFLGELDLYQRFHLDEPWDSPHNRQLIKEMPAVFRSWRSTLPIAEGRSNVVAPSGPHLYWPVGELLSFRDITDGTSNTIMMMQVADELAPVWTQPTPFELNAENALDRTRGFKAGLLPAVLGDGYVGFLKLPNGPGKLFELFTRDGGEVTQAEWLR